MKNLLLTVLLIGTVSFTNPESDSKKADVSFGINYLEGTLKQLEDEVKNLSQEELMYVPKEGGWSIMNCLEHIASTEPAIIDGAKKIIQKNEVISSKDLKQNDGIVIANVTNRGNKVKTPKPFEPTNKYSSVEDVLKVIKEQRASTIKLLKETNSDLRHLFGEYPYGEVDAYQLILVSGAHGYRHTLQIRDILKEIESNNSK